jgi:hypothetical protein
MSREDRAIATLAKLLAILDATKRCSCIEALAEARAIVRVAKAEKALN